MILILIVIESIDEVEVCFETFFSTLLYYIFFIFVLVRLIFYFLFFPSEPS